MTNERILPVRGVELCVDTLGDPADPAIVLIGGSASALDHWADEFCGRLAAGGRFVIRYDHRDTGRSVHYPPGQPGYTGDDLAEDIVGVLDGLGVKHAHLVGISMGGALAQVVALDHPARVDSLVLMSTSLAIPSGQELPSMDPELLTYFSEAKPPDWSDRAAVIEHMVDFERHLAAPAYFDEARVRAVATRVVDRTADPSAALTNHIMVGGEKKDRPGLDTISVPTLVVHGTVDRLFPPAHGEALARAIPGAEYLPLDGVGHQVPPPEVWPDLIPIILRHTSTEPAAPNPLLTEWARGHAHRGGRALVIGGGADAEFVSGLGYTTTAFDIAGERPKDGEAADLLDPPADWLHAFDLVVEVISVQALPDPQRRTAIVNAGRLVAPGGTLIAIATRWDPAGDTPQAGPPGPLRRAEIDAFATDGLQPVGIEPLTDPMGVSRWRAEFRRPAR